MNAVACSRAEFRLKEFRQFTDVMITHDVDLIAMLAK